MEIRTKSHLLESTGRQIASQPQSRVQVVEVSFPDKVELWPVDHGEILITVLKGKGIIRTKQAENTIEVDDQVLLTEGDEFALLPAGIDNPFVVQMYWAPSIDRD
jgi:hypothetical protein